MFENNQTVLFRLGPFHFLVPSNITVQSVQPHFSLFFHQAKSPEGRANKLVKLFPKPFKDLKHSDHEHQKVILTLCTTKSSKQKKDHSISPHSKPLCVM
jgi:hypothetical protein